MVTASKASFELILSHIMIFMTNQLVFWIFEELEETFVYFLRVEDTLIIDVVSALPKVLFFTILDVISTRCFLKLLPTVPKS